MPVSPRPTHHRRRTASMRGTRVVAMAVTGSLGAAGLVLAAGSAAADATPNSQAEGRFLDGSGNPNLDDVATLAPARAHNDGEPTITIRQGIDATVINSVRVPLGTIDLLGENGILDLGAVNQIAIARPSGSSLGASGAVNNDGAIDTGGTSQFPANATLDLNTLLPDTGVLDDLDLSVGALSAVATQASGAHGNQDSSYQIADLELRLDSTVLSGLLAPLLGQQADIDALGTDLAALGDLSPVGSIVDISALPVIQDLLDDIVGGDGVLGNGLLTVNLTNGVITIDLGASLNNQPPNTPLLTAIAAALGDVEELVENALARLQVDVEDALRNVTATVAIPGVLPGVMLPPVPLVGAADLIDTVADALDLTPAGASTGQIDDGILNLLPGVLELTVNVQDEPPNTVKPAGSGIVDEFTVTALRIDLLNSTAVVNLASASVGSNFGPQGVAAPVATDIDPDRGPVAGGTVVTITGTGFEPGSTVSVDGGPPITPDAINGNGTQLVYTAPAHAAGPVDVTVTTPAGTTAPLTYTYIPAGETDGLATPVITNPDNGDETEDRTPPITGTGTPSAKVTIREGSTVICTAIVRSDRTFRCTPRTPLSIGSHTITARQTLDGRRSGTSAPVTFRIAAVDGRSGGQSNSGGLPNTGGGVDPLPFGVAGLALVLAGLAVAAGRRREDSI
ncbi:MAG: choice-of-anchor G family protein [Sporichthyaceae bacterium]